MAIKVESVLVLQARVDELEAVLVEIRSSLQRQTNISAISAARKIAAALCKCGNEGFDDDGSPCSCLPVE